MIIAASVIAFVSAAAIDVVYVLLIHWVSADKTHRAALASVALNLLGLVSLLFIFDMSRWIIIPESIGLYLGTLLGMSLKERIDGKKKAGSNGPTGNGQARKREPRCDVAALVADQEVAREGGEIHRDVKGRP